MASHDIRYYFNNILFPRQILPPPITSPANFFSANDFPSCQSLHQLLLLVGWRTMDRIVRKRCRRMTEAGARISSPWVEFNCLTKSNFHLGWEHEPMINSDFHNCSFTPPKALCPSWSRRFRCLSIFCSWRAFSLVADFFWNVICCILIVSK